VTFDRDRPAGGGQGQNDGPRRDREVADAPEAADRRPFPTLLVPFDPDAPVSGHVPPPESATPIAEAPEHDWAAASTLVYPALRPVGTQGLRVDQVRRDRLADEAARSHAQPLIDDGPAGLPVVYAIAAGGFDVIANGDHLLSWGVDPPAVRAAAMHNLATWSATAPWTDEVSGDRRLVSSDSGDGWDAARILLPDVRAHLTEELGATGRVLVGLPERHLLVAGTMRPGDEEFAALFGQFIEENSSGADEPIDGRIFELVGGRLVPFVP
jgi:hypothetical protein